MRERDHPGEPDPIGRGSSGSAITRPGRTASTLFTGLAVGLIGGVLVGLGEALLAGLWAWRAIRDEPFPFDLLAASIGRAALTHVLLWCPVVFLLAALLAAIRRRRKNDAPAGWLLSGAFVGLSGIVVVTGDFGPLQFDTTIRLGLGALAAALVGFAVMALGAWLGRRLGRRRSRRTWQWTSVAAALVLVGFAIPFVRSPLYWPAHWRLPQRDRAGPRRGPHVLWIMLDTVRADHMSVYGNPEETTPFLDKWAESAAVFEQAYGDGIWTVPSQSSMFTGLPARVHGATSHHVWLDGDRVTLAEALRDAGYATAGFSNNPMVTHDTNLAQGFDLFRVVTHLRRISRFSLDFLLERYGIRPPVPWLRGDYGAGLTSQLADQWLEAVVPQGRPVFVYVNLMEAHQPYRVPGAYRRMYMTDEQRLRSYKLRKAVYGDQVQAIELRFNVEGPGFFHPSDRETLRRLYDSAIRYLDGRAAELVRMFDQHGLLDDTLVVISSDHGEHLGEHGIWGHRLMAYNDIAHIAVILREPGRTRGVRVSTPVQPSDLFGTILNATIGTDGGLPHSDARDLIALAAGAESVVTPTFSGSDSPAPATPSPPLPTANGAAATAETSRIAVTEYFGPDPSVAAQLLASPDETIRRRAVPRIAVTDGRFKLIRSADGREELYDLESDPGELHDLIERRPEGAVRLGRYLDDWSRRVRPREPRESDRAGASPEVLKSLRGLGYVGDDP
jgi:arylsulfatase A-like enzyme